MSRLGNILNAIVGKLGDTGWISLEPYLQSGWTKRDANYYPRYRITHGVVYFAGEVYSTSAKNTKNGTLFSGLPSALTPANAQQISGGGYRYGGTPFSIWVEKDISDVVKISVNDQSNIAVQSQYSGYPLSAISPYIVVGGVVKRLLSKLTNIFSMRGGVCCE